MIQIYWSIYYAGNENNDDFAPFYFTGVQIAFQQIKLTLFYTLLIVLYKIYSYHFGDASLITEVKIYML